MVYLNQKVLVTKHPRNHIWVARNFENPHLITNGTNQLDNGGIIISQQSRPIHGTNTPSNKNIKITSKLTTGISPNTMRKEPTTECQPRTKKLPVCLLSNIQSFGNSVGKDKTTEIETVLEMNNIDVACLTETWLTENTEDQIVMEKYVPFHKVINSSRCKCSRSYRKYLYTFET